MKTYAMLPPLLVARHRLCHGASYIRLFAAVGAVMMDDQPLPEPRGALVPPRSYPPTAIGLATPPPPRPRPLLWRLVTKVLDALDHLADGIARALRLR
ncbi:MAG: hypothetical protein ACT4P6_21940 [Gemmatimonadaceae bacterium]